jgi:hypothetical protein
MATPVDVFWINFKGEEDKYKTLAPGGKYT